MLTFQVKLQTLDVAGNKIKKIENLSHLSELEEFWVKKHLTVVLKAIKSDVCDKFSKISFQFGV